MDDSKYYWGFGVTYLNDDYSCLEVRNESKGNAYLHERIHFIQNFSTLYGVNKSVNVLGEFCKEIRCLRDGDSFSGWNYLCDIVHDAYCAPEGDDALKDIMFLNKIINRESMFEDEHPEYSQLFQNDVIIKYNGTEEYTFGGDAVCESMAYQFEKYIYNNFCYEGQLPYDACDQVYKYKMGCKCENIPVMIALTYVSLMNKNPGKTFVSILDEAKAANVTFNSMTDVFDFQEGKLRYVTKETINHIENRIDELFPVDIVEKAIDPYFKEFSRDLKHTNKWLKEKLTFLIENESIYREALIYFLEQGNVINREQNILALLKEYGNPIIVDKTGRLYPEDSNSLVFLLAPLAFDKALVGDGSCLLAESCKIYDGAYIELCETDCKKKKEIDCILKYYLLVMGLNY